MDNRIWNSNPGAIMLVDAGGSRNVQDFPDNTRRPKQASSGYRALRAASTSSAEIRVTVTSFRAPSATSTATERASNGPVTSGSNCAPGSSLDVNGVSTANGAVVQLWQSNGQANQKWSVQAP